MRARLSDFAVLCATGVSVGCAAQVFRITAACDRYADMLMACKTPQDLNRYAPHMERIRVWTQDLPWYRQLVTRVPPAYDWPGPEDTSLNSIVGGD